ncbi:MAG: hypothetical protein GY847_13935 [Proteobacteria bacterium]|nr:hypothetical protein [Pseudomonadota bacterium]
MTKRVPLQTASRLNLQNEKCVICGKQAEVRYRRRFLCGECLNPDPGAEYMRLERERVNGQWGGLPTDAWNKS